MTEGRDSATSYTRRSVLGASAALGVTAAGVPSATAKTVRQRDHRPAAAPHGSDGTDAIASSAGLDTRAAGNAAQATDLWGASTNGRGIGVRGNGRVGVRGEGTHTGVAGDGYVGVRGTTSIVRDGAAGVGVWAEANTGGVALRADGRSELNGRVDFAGITAFARSGVVTVRSGRSRATETGWALSDSTVILATLQDRVDGVHVHAVKVDPALGSFTIFLTRAAASDVRVGWFALG
jgi:hypothetical protein